MTKLSLSLPWKVFDGFMCLSAIYLVYGYFRYYSEWLQIVGSVWFIFMSGYYFFHLFDHLVFDEDGFQYRSLGVLYSGKWSDVERIANQRHIFPALASICQGAYIPKSKLTSGQQWLTSRDLFIPLSKFVPNWQESVQRQKVNEYVSQSQSKIIDS